MPPLTLAILASALQMQGADATVSSDNKGLADLLSDIRGQLQNEVDSHAPRVIMATYSKVTGYSKGGKYSRTYNRIYGKWVNQQ